MAYCSFLLAMTDDTADGFSDSDDYENLDLSFDDIQGFPTTRGAVATDPTVFSKPLKSKKLDVIEEDYILGTLVIRVVAARDLESAETVGLGNLLFGGGGGKKHGSANPYASVRFGETTQRTSTVYKTLDPIWPRGETMYMDVTHPPTELQTIQNQNNGGMDDNPRLFARRHSSRGGEMDYVDEAESRTYGAPLNKELSVAVFHASDYGKSNKSHAPVKKHYGDSDDIFLGMLSVDMTPLITGKVRTLDDWILLTGGSMRTRASVRIVAEYEASDAPPHRGDLVRFTQFCHPADLYPALVDGYYTVVEDGVGSAGDNVLISYTSAEGWISTFQCHRFMLITVERHTSSLDHLENEVISIAQRLSVSPAANAVQETLERVPDDGLVAVGATVLQGAGTLFGRWLEGGLGRAIEDIALVTNWDGRFTPSTADHLSDSFDDGDGDDEGAHGGAASADQDSFYYSDDSDMIDSPIGQALPNMPSCPITQEPMREPVVAADGHTYERSAIVRWLKTSDKSPLTGSLLPHKNLVPNYMLLSSLQENARLLPVRESSARSSDDGDRDEDDSQTMEVKID